MFKSLRQSTEGRLRKKYFEIRVKHIYIPRTVLAAISHHSWLPAKVKYHAKVMYPANTTQRFSWLTRSTSILLRKNVQIYITHIF